MARGTPGERNGLATIWVEDEGPGVPPGQRHRVWDAYVRLDRDRAQSMIPHPEPPPAGRLEEPNRHFYDIY